MQQQPAERVDTDHGESKSSQVSARADDVVGPATGSSMVDDAAAAGLLLRRRGCAMLHSFSTLSIASRSTRRVVIRPTALAECQSNARRQAKHINDCGGTADSAAAARAPQRKPLLLVGE